MQTQNHISLEVSATKVQVLNKSKTEIKYKLLCDVIQGLFVAYLKETCLGEEQKSSNGVAADNNGNLGGTNGVLGGDREVVGGGNGVLGGDNGTLGGGNGVSGGANGVHGGENGGGNRVLRSNTGFVSI